MPNLTTNKLRRSPAELSVARVAAQEKPVSWCGLALDDLAAALAQTHHEKIIWKRLAISISTSLEDQAVAFVQHVEGQWVVLSDDGLHDQLRQAIIRHDPLCPFLDAPNTHHNALLESLSAFPEATHLYEFIEHYWGWQLASEQKNPIYLMVFGSERRAPSALALKAAQLAHYVCLNISTDKRRQQLISDLSAEVQGLRISAASALNRRLEQWATRNDATQ